MIKSNIKSNIKSDIKSNIKSNIDLNEIHKNHMSVSYDKSNKIYRYLDSIVNSNENNRKTFTISTRLTIGTNRLNCIDTCLLFLSGNINVTKQKISNYVDEMTHDKINKFKHLWSIQTFDNNMKYLLGSLKQDLTNNSKKVCGVVREEYSKLLFDDFKYVVMWIYDIIFTLSTLISKACDDNNINNSDKTFLEELKLSSSIGHLFLNENDSDGYSLVENYGEVFVGIYHFLSNLEWFHMLVTLILYDEHIGSKNMSQKYSLVFGEINMIEYEYIHTYSLFELKTLFTHDYMSHSVLYVIGKDILYVYDPDDLSDSDDDKFNSLDSLNYILDFSSIIFPDYNHDLIIDKLKYAQICNECITKSIQTITNDQYCIFHCIWFVLRLIDSLSHRMNQKNFIHFLKHIDKLNKMTTINDVRFFIHNLKEKSTLHEKQKGI